MKEGLGISEKLVHKIRTEKRDDQKRISYSQFSVYQQCQYRWYLTYAKGNYLFTSSINTIFGTAIHETIQKYLTLLFNEGVKQSEEFEILPFFEEHLRAEYLREVANNNGVHFSNKIEMEEFYQDGVEILNTLKKNRKVYFPHDNFELLGMEIPIRVEIKDDSDVFLFDGFIDMIIKDNTTGEIFIEDFKTSTKGWSTYEKKDEIKQSQILFYKKFFAKQFGVEIDKIVPRFRILKRKLWENASFPQQRIQLHEPAHGKIKMNEASRRLDLCIENCFDGTGQVIEKDYIKSPSANNCRFCPFSDKPEFCNKKN